MAPIDNSCYSSAQSLQLNQLAGLWLILGAALVICLVAHLLIDFCNKGDKKLKLVFKRKSKYTTEESKLILETYPMISDFIHIPSKNLHQQVEQDVRSKR